MFKYLHWRRGAEEILQRDLRRLLDFMILDHNLSLTSFLSQGGGQRGRPIDYL